MLDTVLDKDLLRFAASVRAATVWLGFSATVEDLPQVKQRVQTLVSMRRDVGARTEAVKSGDPWARLDFVDGFLTPGGVDPETTASTTEMREALVRETLRLLKLDNVVIKGVHVLIESTLGSCSLHLGSGGRAPKAQRLAVHRPRQRPAPRPALPLLR